MSPKPQVLLVLHGVRLTGVLKDITPEGAFSVDLVTGRYCNAYWHVHEAVVHHGRENGCLACHGGMDCMRAKACAVDGVVRVGRCAADYVAWVNVLHVDLHPVLLEVLCDFVLQKQAYVVVFDVPRGIGLARLG